MPHASREKQPMVGVKFSYTILLTSAAYVRHSVNSNTADCSV